MDFKVISNYILITKTVISALKVNLWKVKGFVWAQKANTP